MESYSTGDGYGNVRVRTAKQAVKKAIKKAKAKKLTVKKIERPMIKKVKGPIQLSISREHMTTSIRPDKICITLGFKKRLITVHCGLEDFTKALTGLGVSVTLTLLMPKGKKGK